MKKISRDELKRLIDGSQELVLLEALSESNFAAGHLPGARHFPPEQAESRAKTTIPGQTSTVVVYCASDTCKNSEQAAETLERLGYGDVRVYPGGKKDWEAAGLPLERK